MYSPAASTNLARRHLPYVSHTPHALLLRHGWTQYLDNFEWDHIATLTSRYEVSSTKLAKVFDDKFIRGLAKVAQTRVMWFATTEGGHDDQSRSHLHCALAGTSSLTIRRIESAWPLGFTRVTRYAGRPMLQYLVKSLDKNPDGWRSSRLLPSKAPST